LINPTWTNVTATITSSNGVVSVSPAIGAASLQFYRVLQIPPP
jgi:hypothetical protein